MQLGFPKNIGKTYITVFLFFVPLTSAHWFEEENQMAIYLIYRQKYKVFKSQNVFLGL